MKGEPNSVALVRVDNRLVHGQVLEAWLPALDAHGILVADDEAAGNMLARSAMALAIPPRVTFSVQKLSAAAEQLKKGGAPAPRTLLLVRDVADAVALRKAGVPMPRLNLGNVHFAAGRRQLSPNIFLDAGELDALAALEKDGVSVEIQAVPGERPTSLSQARAKLGI